MMFYYIIKQKKQGALMEQYVVCFIKDVVLFGPRFRVFFWNMV